jgi:UDP-galactopyranose mutase
MVFGCKVDDKMYDWLVVGSGFFGATCARLLTEAGCKVLVIEKEKYVGGYAATEIKKGIVVHKFGPHLWHCQDKKIWNFVRRFAEFNHYQHRVKTIYKDEVYSLPFNLATFHKLWGCVSPEEAKRELNARKVLIENPANMEEQALSMVGEEIYEKFIYGYTRKHWLKEPRELPASIIKRLPVRFTYDDNYFDDPFQGVPHAGYTPLMENMIDGIDLRLETDFFDIDWRQIGKKLIYSGPIDRFFNYQFGELEYIYLRFEEIHGKGNMLGIGQLNCSDVEIPHTRQIEHKHFHFMADSPETIVTREFSEEWDRDKECYYPINNEENQLKYQKYSAKAAQLDDVVIGGRAGAYRYLNMDQTVKMAFETVERELA